MKVIKDIFIELDEEEILRLLSSRKGISRKKRQASKYLLNQISEIIKSSLDIIQPIGMYDIFDSSLLEPAFLFKKSEETVLAVCTIGKELESIGSQYISKGELSKGVIIDAVASHAAEKTAEFLNQYILNKLENQIGDRKITSRFSPGYCQWELSKGQNTIFKHLNPEKIGVSLNKSKMMNPIKSVSFAINIGSDVDEELGKRGCETCDMVNCPYRRVQRY